MKGSRKNARVRPVLVSGWLLLASVGATVAATLRVPSEYPTIQAGLDASVAGDVVLVAPGTYTDWETRDLGTGSPWTACAFLVDGVILRSEAGAAATILDVSEVSGPQPSGINARLLTSPDTAVEGFTIRTTPTVPMRGLYLFGMLTVRDCMFRDLHVGQTSGAGINAAGNLTVYETEFENCRSIAGGAIYTSNGRLEMYGCTVRDCGEIGVISTGDIGAPIESAWIENCTFEECWSLSNGGTAGLQIDGAQLDGVVVRDCLFRANINSQSGDKAGGLGVAGNGQRTIENCTFLFNESYRRGSALKLQVTTGNAVVRGNTFYGNRSEADYGVAVYLIGTGPIEFSNNVAAGNFGWGTIEEFQVDVDSSCNVFWNNNNGVGEFFVPGPTDREVDPLFCDDVAEDFTLHLNSPCLPANSLGCGLIGAYPQGCGTVSIDSKSWGAIKAKYVEPEEGER